MKSNHKGVWYALGIQILWWIFLVIGLSIEVDWRSPITYILIIIQTHLYTGIFIFCDLSASAVIKIYLLFLKKFCSIALLCSSIMPCVTSKEWL
jgi:hypothetical protein